MRLTERKGNGNRAPAPEGAAAPAADSRRRMRWAALGFLVFCGMIAARLVTLEFHQGAAFRAEATKPRERRLYPPGLRGRIVSREGVVLALDRPAQALAVEYRRLQAPLDPAWLRRTARATLPRAARRDPQRMAEAEARVRVELVDLHRRLAELCGVSATEWERRRTRVAEQVTAISRGVNERRESRDAARVEEARQQSQRWAASDNSWFDRTKAWAWDVLTPDNHLGSSAPIVVAEELESHVLADDLPREVVAEIEAHPELYPGVRIEARRQRDYPHASLAAHLVGHLGMIAPEEIAAASQAPLAHAYQVKDRVGRLGLESRYEPLLRGSHGTSVELVDQRGRVLSTLREREPATGRDLVLTIDAALQETAERLLDGALARRPRELGTATPSNHSLGGGAVLAIDVQSGAMLAAASAPRFDPNLFTDGDAPELKTLLADAAHPLFDRTMKMAIAPGSTFEVASAMALLAERDFKPDEPFDCQGYWRTPEQQRCALYVRDQVGHGAVTLSDALAQDCNVYFFHHAAVVGPPRLIDWALRLEFGRKTGIDLAGEATGFLPTPANIGDVEGHAWRLGDTQSLAVGQGSLTVTPLQMARLMAAIANGGRLVTPYVVDKLTGADDDQLLAAFQPERDSSHPVHGLEGRLLSELREVLRSSTESWQHQTDRGEDSAAVAIAGKAGTAETGGGRESHAWFAGYAPAEAPRVAFVVVLEHAGDAHLGACPVATRLAERMRQLGYFDPAGTPRREQVAKLPGASTSVE